MQVPQDSSTAPHSAALFMRPFALGASAFLLTSNFLYLITRGAFQSPDQWAEVYVGILAAYAGAHEISHLMAKTEPMDSWDEKIRRGGPLITAWFCLLFIAGALRFYDATIPMPPELKTITMQTLFIFTGTYALRQYRRYRVMKSPDGANQDDNDKDKAQVVAFLQEHGPSSPKAILQKVKVSRRTLGRLLQDLMNEDRAARDARYDNDPSATYRLK